MSEYLPARSFPEYPTEQISSIKCFKLRLVHGKYLLEEHALELRAHPGRGVGARRLELPRRDAQVRHQRPQHEVDLNQRRNNYTRIIYEF